MKKVIAALAVFAASFGFCGIARAADVPGQTKYELMAVDAALETLVPNFEALSKELKQLVEEKKRLHEAAEPIRVRAETHSVRVDEHERQRAEHKIRCAVPTDDVQTMACALEEALLDAFAEQLDAETSIGRPEQQKLWEEIRANDKARTDWAERAKALDAKMRFLVAKREKLLARTGAVSAENPHVQQLLNGGCSSGFAAGSFEAAHGCYLQQAKEGMK